jgi:septum formation protein
MTPPLLLASSSPYRRALLERLQLPFIWASPAIDESPLPGETAQALVARLAEAKARALLPQHPGHLIIGSDQVAVLEGRILGKPGNLDNARAQLRAASGRRVEFLTGLCLLDGRDGIARCRVAPFAVRFRQLGEAQIERYLERERPFDCAGSFKAEGLGIALFSALEGRDPNALIGLPLIALVDLLGEAGVGVI